MEAWLAWEEWGRGLGWLRTAQEAEGQGGVTKAVGTSWKGGKVKFVAGLEG